MFPETTYTFKHALTREVVYDSILTSRKKKLHEDFEKSKYHYDIAIRLTEHNRLHPSWINLNNLALARVDVMNDDDSHIADAEIWINKAMEADKNNGMMFHLGQDYALYAQLFKRKGDLLKARENIVKATDILKECGADGWVEKYEEKPASV